MGDAGDDVGERLVCFRLGEQELAAPIHAVKETMAPRALTRAFLVPPVLAGLMNLRGEVIAVLDLAVLLGLPRAASPGGLVLLRKQGHGKSTRAAAALLVDQLLGVVDVPTSQLVPPPAILSPDAAHYLDAVATVGNPQRPVLVISPQRILAAEILRPYSTPRRPSPVTENR